MARCRRCFLHNSIRAVNLIVNICGVGMIIYSLWLLKKWQDGVAYLPSVSLLPRPWFIYTCLGVGIAVCLSTLAGCMVANCISNYTLCIYIVSICSLLFLEVAVLVTIFFKMDWAEELAKYIDENHTEFKTFVLFHLRMCRSILIMILVPQLCVIVLAIILWAIGTEPRTQGGYLNISDFNHSFLVTPNSPSVLSVSIPVCPKCEVFYRANPRQSFLSYVKGLLRIQFQGRTTDS
ncbi:tetraspanin-19-like isoform X1 [Quercus robur]|uniref:tetraspanin-19-like isoform X1 n=1 Tax=Quercus robur TaxID=38942 RepID=UPI002161D4BA|nr:tetraspanin-19-like isoform X1 [Quercus robur]